MQCFEFRRVIRFCQERSETKIFLWTLGLTVLKYGLTVHETEKC